LIQQRIKGLSVFGTLQKDPSMNQEGLFLRTDKR